MSEERDEAWAEAASPRPAEPDVPFAPPPVKTIPAREAMGFIRALANDWEDERSRPSREK
jgi:hypothetical protein